MTKASDLLVSCLEEEGVEYVFGVPGEENLDFLDSGDGVEWEVWNCIYCHESYLVDIEIVRDFKNMKQVKTNETTN